MNGIVKAIYSARAANEPVRYRDKAGLIAGKGLEGDRYFTGSGTFSKKLLNNPAAELTLIEKEEIDSFNRAHGLNLEGGEFRRNIVTQGVYLNDLVGKTFMIGEVNLKGIRLCEPCAHLAKVLHERVLPDLVGHGGLRAQILTTGTIQVGDKIDD